VQEVRGWRKQAGSNCEREREERKRGAGWVEGSLEAPRAAPRSPRGTARLPAGSLSLSLRVPPASCLFGWSNKKLAATLVGARRGRGGRRTMESDSQKRSARTHAVALLPPAPTNHETRGRRRRGGQEARTHPLVLRCFLNANFLGCAWERSLAASKRTKRHTCTTHHLT
jgi:hypothetical protein